MPRHSRVNRFSADGAEPCVPCDTRRRRPRARAAMAGRLTVGSSPTREMKASAVYLHGTICPSFHRKTRRSGTQTSVRSAGNPRNRTGLNRGFFPRTAIGVSRPVRLGAGRVLRSDAGSFRSNSGRSCGPRPGLRPSSSGSRPNRAPGRRVRRQASRPPNRRSCRPIPRTSSSRRRRRAAMPARPARRR